MGIILKAKISMSSDTNNILESESDGNCSINSKKRIRAETKRAISAGFDSGESVLVEAPPAAGKTTTIPEVVVETGISVTYLTERQRLYEQMVNLCSQAGLSSWILPSPHRDCPSFTGDHGTSWEEKVTKRYSRGVNATRLHSEMDLPCKPDCQYLKELDVDPDGFDVLIGHYSHAFPERWIEGRQVVIDEFPGDVGLTTIENPQPIVTDYLKKNRVGYSDWADFIRNPSYRRLAGAICAGAINLDPNPTDIIDNPDNTHSSAGRLVYGLACAKNLGNGFETSYFHVDAPYSTANWVMPVKDVEPEYGLLGDYRVVRNRRTDTVSILSSPDFSSARGVVGLDGTPVPMLWDLVTGENFHHDQILSGDELNEYIKSVQQLTIKQAGKGDKPYSSGRWVSLDHDEALFMGVEINEGPACLITPKKALQKYEQHGLLRYIKDAMNSSQVRSENGFGPERTGIVSGSPHPGDEVIQLWAAFMGEVVSSPNQDDSKDYGPVGNQIYQHYVHNEVLQAILRFGRDGKGAVVYVNTEAIPAWLEVDSFVGVSRFKGEKRREIVHFLRDHQGQDITQQQIAKECGSSVQHVRSVLKDMIDGGYVTRYDHAGRNGKHLYQWNS